MKHHDAPTGEEQRGSGVVVIVMGVAGCGKSTVGEALAARIGAEFVDADDHHPASNVAKMSRGEPLHDVDRWPWLDALASIISEHVEADRPMVMACSALKRSYRDRLGVDGDRVRLVHLEVGSDELARRLRDRRGHFMAVDMLDSQLSALEAPWTGEAVVLDGSLPVEDLVGLLVPLSRTARGRTRG